MFANLSCKWQHQYSPIFIIVLNRWISSRRDVQPKKEGAKPYTKAPRIQRLITPQRLQHKRHLQALKRRRFEKQKEEAAEYANLLAKRAKEESAKREEARKRRASSMRQSRAG